MLKKITPFIRLNKILFSSLTRRIFLFNLIGLVIMLSNFLYLNLIQNNLIDARIENLKVEGGIIANTIASTDDDIIIFPELDPDELLAKQAQQQTAIATKPDQRFHFPINPIRAAPILRTIIYPTRTHAKIFDMKGHLIIDSKHIYIKNEHKTKTNNFFDKALKFINIKIIRRNLPLYKQAADGNGFIYEEVQAALDNNSKHAIRKTEHGETIVSIAVPIKRQNEIVGILHLSTLAGDIDEIMQNDQWAIISVFLITSIVTLFFSILLAYTIATPLRKLSQAAERVKIGIKRKEKIPNFSYRHDEIGNLSIALQDMTQSLYRRIEHIESFAADVSHELKNPLTSLRSAVETLPISQNKEQQAKLLKIIEHDVLRLDRLISDISNASRLDAELARHDPEPVDLALLLQQFCQHHSERAQHTGYPPIQLQIIQPKIKNKKNQQPFIIGAHKDRIGQVLANIIDNARSFIDKQQGKIDISLTQDKTKAIIEICDNGLGIAPENLDKIFDRFYTDRPEHESFGQNSGLGLSITRQIIEAHGGRIIARNNTNGGACFRICLPLCKGKRKK